jgi:hypothetical protein
VDVVVTTIPRVSRVFEDVHDHVHVHVHDGDRLLRAASAPKS